jgi:hypothetical protein
MTGSSDNGLGLTTEYYLNARARGSMYQFAGSMQELSEVEDFRSFENYLLPERSIVLLWITTSFPGPLARMGTWEMFSTTFPNIVCLS